MKLRQRYKRIKRELELERKSTNRRALMVSTDNVKVEKYGGYLRVRNDELARYGERIKGEAYDALRAQAFGTIEEIGALRLEETVENGTGDIILRWSIFVGNEKKEG